MTRPRTADDAGDALELAARVGARWCVWLGEGGFLDGPPLAAALDGDDPRTSPALFIEVFFLLKTGTGTARRAERCVAVPLAGVAGCALYRVLDGPRREFSGPAHASLRVAAAPRPAVAFEGPTPLRDAVAWRVGRRCSGAVVRAGPAKASKEVGEIPRGGAVLLDETIGSPPVFFPFSRVANPARS